MPVLVGRQLPFMILKVTAEMFPFIGLDRVVLLDLGGYGSFFPSRKKIVELVRHAVVPGINGNAVDCSCRSRRKGCFRCTG